MKLSEIKSSAEFLIRRYGNEHMVEVTIRFDDKTGHLIVSYLFDRNPIDDDVEDGELICGELVGEYPAIRTAQTLYTRDVDTCTNINEKEEVIYLRARMPRSNN